jgi:hypothetical protein
MSSEPRKPLLIILVVLTLLIVGLKTDNLAWAGPYKQTVPTAVPTETPTSTPTEEPTATPTNTATLLPTETATQMPFVTFTFTPFPTQAPPDFGDQDGTSDASNLRTFIGIGILLLLGGGGAIGALAWWFFFRKRDDDETQ